MIFFDLFGVKVGLHFSFFAVCSLFFAMRENEWGLWCLLAALMHECGHLAAFCLFGLPPKEIHFEYSGIRMIPQRASLPLCREAVTVLAGAFVNLLCGSILCAAGLWMHGGFHLALGGFNLLPMPGLDGGTLFALLTERAFRPRTQLWLQRFISLIVELPLAAGAIWLAITRQNPTLLLTVCYFFFLGLFGEHTMRVK